MGTALKLTKADPVAHDWARHATALAAWADKHLVNRRDAYGGYYRKDGSTHQTTKKAADRDGPLTLVRLSRHFKAEGTDDVIGLHTIGFDELDQCICRWILIDIDRHADDDDPDANFRAALAWYALALSLGFRPLLYDSNGRGGYHLVLVFSEPVPSRDAFAFAQWLIRDWETRDLDKPPEAFPKQPGIARNKFGNWTRLPGRHHTRDHFTRVWSGESWLEGAAAIRRIIGTAGTSPDAIPAEARPAEDAPFDLGADINRKRAARGEEQSGNKQRRPPAADGSVDAGTDFNARAAWDSILTPHGWRLDHESEGTGFWRRPGKEAGQSATTNHSGNDTLYVFTDATAFVQHGSYSKFGAYAVLNHGGNFEKATAALSLEGYGKFAAWIWDEESGQWSEGVEQNPCPKGGHIRIRTPGKGVPVIPAWSKWNTLKGRKGYQENGHHGNGHAGGPPEAGDPTDEPPGPIAPIEADDDPHRLARVYRDGKCMASDGLTLRYWRGQWWRWDGSAYREAIDTEVKADLVGSIKVEADRLNILAQRDHARRKAEGEGKRGRPLGDPPAAMKVTTSLVGNATLALTGYSVISSITEQPAWLDGPGAYDPREMLAARNALVHLPSLIAGRPCMTSPTPRFFSPQSLDYDFVPSPLEPSGWLRFLSGLWPDDPDPIATLQEWFGYLLTPDTAQQKILMMIGPKRSGKGTILRILKALIGAGNVVNPRLNMLATPFGLAPLIGKTAAIITDAKLSRRADQAAIVEALLAISGEDDQTIDRKHRESWSGRLPTRFILAGNELPKFKDSGGALSGRMVMLKLTRSFYGQEDTALTEQLLAELPGILGWAIAGWARLHERGFFIQPESSNDLVEDMESITSPIGRYVKERCEVGPGFIVTCKTLHGDWKDWCDEKGEGKDEDSPENETAFGRALRTVVPDVDRKQRRLGGAPVWHYIGVKLNQTAALAAAGRSKKSNLF